MSEFPVDEQQVQIHPIHNTVKIVETGCQTSFLSETGFFLSFFTSSSSKLKPTSIEVSAFLLQFAYPIAVEIPHGSHSLPAPRQLSAYAAASGN